jgi:hypothetical protein
MDRGLPTGRTRMPQRRTRPSVGQATNNIRTTEAVNEPAVRRRLIVPRRPITNANQIQTARIPRVPPRRAPPPVRIALDDDEFETNNNNDDDQVVNLITPTLNRQTERRQQRNDDNDREVRRELFRQVESDSSDDDDDDVFDEDEPHFLHTAHVIDDDDDDDDSDNDINIILNDLHAEERAETEQERQDRELARRLQMEENLSFNRVQHATHQAPQQAPQIATHRHFGDMRNDDFAQRLQHAELQEQAAAMARRRIMLEQVFARYGIPFDHQRPRLYIGGGGNAPQPVNRGLMSLHFVDRDFDERDYETLLQLDDHVPNRKMADAKLVEKVPVTTVKAGDKYDRCSVCLCDMEAGEVRRELPCSHGFHKDCIDKWLKDYKDTCPICKQSLSDMEPKLEQLNKKRKLSESNTARRHKKRKVTTDSSE